MDPSTPDLDFHAPSIEELQPLFPAYEIGGFIAQGGMGAVYVARQISLDRPVAIKILPQQFGADPQFRASFEAEAKAMARLNHPNLISVYDFGDADGMLYIIMELVEGKSLHHSAYGKAIEQQEAARIVAGICHGLAHAHQAGILHRDIKPGNILLGPGAVPKIGDFGLARPVGAVHNPDEIVWGTPGYTAPEVLESPNAVDQRADIFAVGVLLYELLTARTPPEPWQAPSTLCGCAPEFDAIVRRATQPSPEQRYESAAEIAAELDKLIEHLKSGRVRRTVTTAAGRPGSPSPALGVRPAKPYLAPPRKSAAPVIIVVLLIGIAAIAGIIIASSGKRSEKTTQPPGDPSPPAKPVREKKPPPRPPVVKEPRPRPERPEPKPDPDPPKPERPEQPAEESPTQALARLKPKLLKGELGELPEGTVQRGEAHFFLVPSPLPWHQASRFAEDHGAQLAVLESKEDLAWASEQFELTAPIWLGLSDSGTEAKWFWVNGRSLADDLWAPGQPDNAPSRDDGEDYAALLPGEMLDDLSSARELAFLLQWPADGARTGSLTAQIERVGEALKSRRAVVFPAGTRNIGGSRFLLVPHARSWEEASAVATAAGGHLAVPSSPDERDWINGTLEGVLGGGDGCWVGGHLTGVANPLWTFVTGEKFDFITWAPEEPKVGDPPRSALQVRRSVDGQFGYFSATGDPGEASYYLLEWSAPSHRNMPSKEDMKRRGSVEEWLLAQRQETSDREQAAYLRYKRRHDRNLEDFIADIESEAETARRFSKEIEDYVKAFRKALEASGEIPADLGSERAKRFIGELHADALEKQNDIWDDYKTEFQLAKDRYLADLKAEYEARRRQGDRNGTAYLEREMKAAAADPYFKEILSGVYPPVPEAEDENETNDDE